MSDDAARALALFKRACDESATTPGECNDLHEKLQASLFELAQLWIEHLGTQIDVRHITTEQLCLFLTLVLDNISTPRCYFEDMGLVDLLMEGAEKSLMDLYTAETEKPDEVRVSQTRAVGV